MGISGGEWFVGIIGVLGLIASVVLGFMLQSAQGQRIALWEAIAKVREDGQDTAQKLAGLCGEFKQFVRICNGRHD